MRYKILIVDDDYGTIAAIQGAIAEQFTNHQPPILCDGELAYTVGDAQALISENRYDLILIDQCMTGDPQKCEGIDLLTVAKRHDANVPVLILTSYPNAVGRSQAYKYGAHDYVAKAPDNEAGPAGVFAVLDHNTIVALKAMNALRFRTLCLYIDGDVRVTAEDVATAREWNI